VKLWYYYTRKQISCKGDKTIKNLQINTNRHACYKLVYHLVVVTKYRHSCINKEILDRINTIAVDLFSKWGGNILEFNGEGDHIHILFETPPQVQLSKIINNFKTVSSRYVRKEFSAHLGKYYWKPYFWSNSYLVISTGGATIEIIKQYIKEQDVPE